MKINDEGINFIVGEETGGKDYYEKVYKKTFCWPGGASGCTAMVGIDIGYYSKEEVERIFNHLASPEEMKLIQGGRGKTGESAKAYLKNLKGIEFEWDEAIQSFKDFIMPKFIKLAEQTFPGVDKLKENAQTAILSLVFNRGISLKGERRTEMAEIKKLIPKKDYEGIAKQLRSMKRLWNKGNGLIGRREREAKLVESCIS